MTIDLMTMFMTRVDQDSKQIAKEAIHIRINTPALNCITTIMYIPEIFYHFLGTDRSSDKSNPVADSYCP